VIAGAAPPRKRRGGALAEFSYRLRVSAKRRRRGLDTDYGTAGRLPDTHCGQPPRRKRRVADIDMSKKVLNQPGIHTLLTLRHGRGSRLLSPEQEQAHVARFATWKIKDPCR
jgi:hypothetical protein